MSGTATPYDIGSGAQPVRPIRRLSVRMSVPWLALLLAVIVAARGDTRDTAVYIEAFSGTTSFPLNPLAYYSDWSMEWGFGLGSWLFNTLGMGPRTLFFVISLLTFLFIRQSARRLRMNFYEVMPFYLGSFFLTQQFMQIRQGLGVAFAFWAIIRWTTGEYNTPVWRKLGALVIAACFHIVSLVPMIAAMLIQPSAPQRRVLRMVLWVLALAGVSIAVARVFSGLALVQLFDRLSMYAEDQEYGSARNLFDPANVRAVMLLLLFTIGLCKRELQGSRAYVLMIGLYALHVGLRIGFLEIQILSGRLATTLGFAEVFLVPMMLRACVGSRDLRWFIAAIYLGIHATATLMLQAPFLIDDYFTHL